MDGKWIRTCSVQVPYVEKGEVYKVYVRHSMKEPKKSSRFYSFKYDSAEIASCPCGPRSAQPPMHVVPRICADRLLPARRTTCSGW